MKLCPYCAEEIQDAAIRCKHCRADLPPVASSRSSPTRRNLRWLIAGAAALAALLAAVPVVARPLLRHLQSDRCEPTNWIEWHLAMRRQCLTPSYVCEHMTTPGMMQDPEVAQSFGGGAEAEPSRLSEMVGRMRSAYGCAPESGSVFQSDPEVSPHVFPIPQDVTRHL